MFLELVGSELRTGLISEDGSTITRGVRVFVAEFGIDFPNVTDEPGVQSLPGGLGSATSFRFDMTKALRKWNGADFSLIAAESITADLGPLSVTSPANDTFTPGFAIALDASGSHEHPDWTLGAPSSDGVYLLEVQWQLNTGQTSLPTWMIWNQNADAATVDAAFDFAQATIPSPGALGIAGMSSWVLMRRRRRMG